jgi:hypothetical protein
MIVRATRQAQRAVDYILGGSDPNLGSAGVSGEDVPQVIAQKLGLDLPQSYVGDYGRTGDEITAETGVASVSGNIHPGISNSGELGGGMKYDLEMYQTRVTSGAATGEQYGVRRVRVGGNTYDNREALKNAGFKYDSETKTWTKSYLRTVFPVGRLTQEVSDNNPDFELKSDIEKLRAV